MEDLILPASNTTEENILAIIEFVKQVERERGLSDDEIIYKYTCGACMSLVYCVKKAIKEVYNEDFKELETCFFVGESGSIDHHVYLKLNGKNENEDLYFDLFGKKTKQEVDDFMTSDFWKDLKGSRDWSDIDRNKAFWKDDYVLKACKEHVIAELTTSIRI